MVPFSPASLVTKPITFGTDGWRGVIAADFTVERLIKVAPLAALALEQTYGSPDRDRTIIVGYDRRFLSEEFASATAEVVRAAGYDVMLSESYAPTPAFSWAAKQQNALGALVITASHNPGIYSGLKVKSAFGGSVSPDVTQKIEVMLKDGTQLPAAEAGSLQTFNPWQSYCEVLRSKVNIEAIQEAIGQGKLMVFVDVMHGAAAGGLAQLLGDSVEELNSDRDPLFGGGAPEPLPRYLSGLFRAMKEYRQQPGAALSVGLVFDGDSDRIAAVDGQGGFLSSQVLIPVLIEHLAVHRGFEGEIVKTISGSNLIPKVAKLHNLSVHETAIGYKYIADRMLEAKVLLGGEESGGIGYGNHIPERDALLSALYVLEAMVQSRMDLSDRYRQLQQITGYSSTYDRTDLPLASMEVRSRLLNELETNLPTAIAGQAVTDCLT
ncbi:MAG: phosphoglucomutase/phosphomannomutase family protein, partial [Cyanobacteria bacterium CAN_BIN43]|nr:phosphoglucomutase/phosphomannomutase family protein [Cyanobacteria bacterium CAN_BIN43]